MIDKDLLRPDEGHKRIGGWAGPSCITATFDGRGPYMRLIASAGTVLDLLLQLRRLCHGEQHSFDEYAQWPRQSEDSAIFYATTGLTCAIICISTLSCSAPATPQHGCRNHATHHARILRPRLGRAGQGADRCHKGQGNIAGSRVALRH